MGFWGFGVLGFWGRREHCGAVVVRECYAPRRHVSEVVDRGSRRVLDLKRLQREIRARGDREQTGTNAIPAVGIGGLPGAGDICAGCTAGCLRGVVTRDCQSLGDLRERIAGCVGAGREDDRVARRSVGIRQGDGRREMVGTRREIRGDSDDGRRGDRGAPERDEDDGEQANGGAPRPRSRARPRCPTPQQLCSAREHGESSPSSPRADALPPTVPAVARCFVLR